MNEYVLAAAMFAAIGAAWDIGRRIAEGKGLRPWVEMRCDRNTQATESLAKQVAERFQQVENKLVAVGITRPPSKGVLG